MKILWIFVLVQTALAQSGFGKSYLKNSNLCHQWSCLNRKLGLTDSLPTSEEFGIVLRRLLPPGSWQDVVDSVLNTCYHDRPRRYSNTCPGQAIMHCAVDQLIANCPEASLRKEDACAPIGSMAGFKYLFTQSRYENMEMNMAVERRPAWFLKNYFNSKCCHLPPLFDSSTLSECGISSVMLYYQQNPQVPRQRVLPSQTRNSQTIVTTPAYNGDSLQIVRFADTQADNNQIVTDPLDCCDVTDFLQPSWRQECNFELSWQGQSRLVIKSDTPPSTTAAPFLTSTSSSVTRRDLVLVPETCEKSTCVFNKLDILSSNGTVDRDAFIKLLDKLTTSQPKWTSAKGRVVTTCLRKPVTEYDAQCEINKILACTFDVLTENCPDAKKSDSCKHMSKADERECQISSSKYRPKNRREVCALPSLVDAQILTECGLPSLDKKIPLTTLVKPKRSRLFSWQSKCLDLTPSTKCVMRKMGTVEDTTYVPKCVDGMKNRINNFTSQNGWQMSQMYLNAFNYGPLYREHCNSPKKLLNVIDSMLMTCPDSKRKNTAQCTNLLTTIANTPAATRNASEEYAQQMLKHFHQVLFPAVHTPPRHITAKKIKKTPISNYAILNDKYAPKVITIDVKPKAVTTGYRPPLVLLPVYMRVPNSNLILRRPFLEDGVMRGVPQPNKIAQAHLPTVFSTTRVTTTPISNTTDFANKN